MRLDTGRYPDVELHLDPECSPTMDILHNSLYVRKLAPYLEGFPRDQMHFVVFDDIEDRPRDVLNDLCRFLEVEPLGELMLVEEKVNARDRTWLSPRLLRLVRGINCAEVRSGAAGDVFHKALRSV
jgi:hypothetical protein